MAGTGMAEVDGTIQRWVLSSWVMWQVLGAPARYQEKVARTILQGFILYFHLASKLGA